MRVGRLLSFSIAIFMRVMLLVRLAGLVVRGVVFLFWVFLCLIRFWKISGGMSALSKDEKGNSACGVALPGRRASIYLKIVFLGVTFFRCTRCPTDSAVAATRSHCSGSFFFFFKGARTFEEKKKKRKKKKKMLTIVKL
jgi:hypothetical protein